MRQFIIDLVVVAWVYVWIHGAMRLFDLVQQLAVPGQKLEGAGNGLADSLGTVGDKIGDVPVAGKSLAGPFASAAGAARSLASAGQDQQDVINQLAWVLSVMLLAVPLGLVLFGWLPLRIRWVRRASAASRLRGVPAGRDLLALRGLATQPLGRLVKLHPDIAPASRR